jgi:eukaryotic-like serine/threonine-protein kinase
MPEESIQRRALERQRLRLAELEQQITQAAAACPPNLLEERDEILLIVAMLEARLPALAAAELPQSLQPPPSLELLQRIIWPADGKEMVLVPAGTFINGAERSHRGDDQPAHELTLPAFYIDRTPVTIAEYGRFIAATGHAKPKIMFTGAWPHDYEQHPVTGVSWHDARAYVAWVRKRLPTEAEWEKAASWDWTTGTKRRYPWGDQWDARRCNMIDTGIGRTSAVGSFSPSGDAPCGAVDMAGNVCEWTSSLDWNYPCQLGDGRDDVTRYGLRVRRGGSYGSGEVFTRTTTRYLIPPDGLFFADGFRCVVEPQWLVG